MSDDGAPKLEIFRICNLDSGTFRKEGIRVLHLIQHIVPLASVMEVGSTAVEGVVGNQDIDFVARVPIARFEETRRVLDEHFQRNANQLSNVEYQGYFVPSQFDVAIQPIVADGKHDNFERFLELLNEYSCAKQAFIDKALSKPQSPP